MTELKAKKKLERADAFHYVRIVIAVLLVVAAILLGYFGYRLGTMVFTDEPLTDSIAYNITYDLTVEEGDSALEVGEKLEKAHIIESALAFAIQTKLYDCTIGPGIYEVSSNKSSKDIARYLNTEYMKTLEDETS